MNSQWVQFYQGVRQMKAGSYHHTHPQSLRGMRKLGSCPFATILFLPYEPTQELWLPFMPSLGAKMFVPGMNLTNQEKTAQEAYIGFLL